MVVYNVKSFFTNHLFFFHKHNPRLQTSLCFNFIWDMFMFINFLQYIIIITLSENMSSTKNFPKRCHFSLIKFSVTEEYIPSKVPLKKVSIFGIFPISVILSKRSLCSSTFGPRPLSSSPVSLVLGPKNIARTNFWIKHITYLRLHLLKLKHHTYSRFSKSYLERRRYGVQNKWKGFSSQ